jgi:hypothetical protein
MTKQELAFRFAQRFDSNKPVYTTKEAISIASSKSEAYRLLEVLRYLGIIKYTRRYFTINTTLVSQSINLIEKILPSLEALSRGKRFARYYDESDINFAMKNVNHKLVTLDYAAWELTKYQSTLDYYVYVKDVEQTVTYLKENKFHEGQKGHVIILPMIGDFTNELQRIYFDCLAYGGRSIQDAVAIELLFRDRLSYKASFPIELIQKIEEDLPIQQK